MKILVVEDDGLVAATVVEALKVHGFEAEAAAGTDDALKLASTKPFDLALVDARLAFGDSGIASCQLLLEQYSVPSLMMTGGADIPPHVGNFALGVLHKPFSQTDLASAMKAMFRLLSGERPDSLPKQLRLFTGGDMRAVAV